MSDNNLVPTPETRERAYRYRSERLANIAAIHNGVGALVAGYAPVTEHLRTQGWDDESIAMWLTAPNTYLGGLTPVVAWDTGDPKTRDTVLYAAQQRAHV